MLFIYLFVYLCIYLFVYLFIYLFTLSQELGTLETIKLIILVLLKPKGLKIIPYVEETKLIKS